MIADDNAEMRSFLKSILQRPGVEFTECSNGAEAIACYAPTLPEWTLMDIAMKPIDGITATREIVARYPDARVLVITQEGSPGRKAAARKAGAWGFLLKDNLSLLPGILFEGASSPDPTF